MALRLGQTLCHLPLPPSKFSMKATRTRKLSVRNCMLDIKESRKLVLEVKEKLETKYPTLPLGKNGRDDEDMILWFLKDRKFSVGDAVAKLTKAIKWRQEFQVSELSEELVKNVAQTGKSYVHDFLDVNNRPVLMVVPSKHFPRMQDPSEDEKLCVYMIEKALSKLPAGKEEILGIFDLRGFGTANADLNFLTFLVGDGCEFSKVLLDITTSTYLACKKSILERRGDVFKFDVFYCYYPKRLGEVLLVEAPFVFQPIWQLVKPLLKSYASLVRFCSVETVRKEYFTKETLPASFRDSNEL